MAKQKTKRQKTPYAGLVKKVNGKRRWEYMDQDYIDKLSDKEKQWLSNFMEEELGGNFKHKGKKLNTSKKNKRRCYGNNNARNRDTYAMERWKAEIGIAPWYGSEEMPKLFEGLQEKDRNSQEDKMIQILDIRNEISGRENPQEALEALYEEEQKSRKKSKKPPSRQ